MTVTDARPDDSLAELAMAATSLEESRAVLREHFLQTGVATDAEDAAALADFELRDLWFDVPVPDSPNVTRRNAWRRWAVVCVLSPWLGLLLAWGWFRRGWKGRDLKGR